MARPMSGGLVGRPIAAGLWCGFGRRRGPGGRPDPRLPNPDQAKPTISSRISAFREVAGPSLKT